MNDNIKEKLLEYQIPHVENIINSLKRYNRCLDASDTGTGKTFTSIAVCAQMNLKPLIICPKSVISSWTNVLNFFGIDWYGVSNYETLHNCKMFTKQSNNIKVNCPYISRTKIESPEKEKDNNLKLNSKKTDKINDNTPSELFTFIWKNIPNDMIVIFDEAHRCKNARTNNSVLLYTLSKTTTKILMLSATVSDKPENFALAGYVLGLYRYIKDSENWIGSVSQGMDNKMAGVNKILYPNYASRMRIRDLGKLFPDNQITAECYDMETAEEIEKAYKLIETEVEKLKKKEMSSCNPLVVILYARMRIETLKIPTFIEQAKKNLEEGNSVAIFVNFTQTLKTIAEELNTSCVIHGQQTCDERNKAINDFNNDVSQIIICNSRSGGVGISLHDTNGNFPRVSIISPSWSAQDIIQVLGRIHRANGKTHTRQKIIFCKNTIEETVCKNMKEKIKNIALLNDGDLLSYNIDGLTDDYDQVGIDTNQNLSEFDKLFLKLEVLNIRKERLKYDMAEVENEIKNITTLLNNCVE